MQLHTTVERSGAVAVVRFVNPPSGLITRQGAAQLADAIESLLGDASVRVLVLTGAAFGVFIHHADVSQIVRAGDALLAERIGIDDFLDSPFMRLTRLCDRTPIPVIAAIDGTCTGGGFEIALACTLRVAGRSVEQIGLPEIRIGLFPGAGGTQRLRRLIGSHRARAFILRGAVVAADEALALGLVDEVAPTALARAMQWADELAGRSPAAVRAILELTRTDDDDTGLREEGRRFAALLKEHPETLAHLRSFLAGGGDLGGIS
jgi:enoyl-CoA hydratase/carnithine racemase